MVKEAEAAAAEDHKRRETAEARNQADQLVYQVDRFVSENADKIPEADRTELATVNDRLKEALKDENAEAAALTEATESVMSVFSRIGQSMYQNVQASEASAQGESPAAGDEATASNDDEVVEGEIVEEGGGS